MRWRSPGKERARERTSRIVFDGSQRVSVYYLNMNRWFCGVGVENEVGCRRELLEVGRDVLPPNQRVWPPSHWRAPLDVGEALQQLCDAWWTTS